MSALCVLAFGRDAPDLFGYRDLAENVGQERGVAHVASGDFNGPELKRFPIDPEMDLSPDAAFGTTVLARVPIAFVLNLDA